MNDEAEASPPPPFRPALSVDTPALISLAEATRVFRPGEAEILLKRVLDGLHAGRLPDGHQARVWAEGADAPPVGWVYFAPTENTDGVWDLWWIGVAPTRQGRGFGGKLLHAVEDHVRRAGGRLLIIETSSLTRFERTRGFYVRNGYSECGRIPDFYADGDDKVIYARRLGREAG